MSHSLTTTIKDKNYSAYMRLRRRLFDKKQSIGDFIVEKALEDEVRAALV